MRARFGLIGSWVLACALAAACSSDRPRPTSIGAIAAQARENKVGAFVRYQEKPVALRGRVARKGLKSDRLLLTEFSSIHSGVATHGSTFGATRGEATTRRATQALGYLVIESNDSVPGRGVCLFEPEEIEQIAPLADGDVVDLNCVFNEFIGSDADPWPVFYSCNVAGVQGSLAD